MSTNGKNNRLHPPNPSPRGSSPRAHRARKTARAPRGPSVSQPPKAPLGPWRMGDVTEHCYPMLHMHIWIAVTYFIYHIHMIEGSFEVKLPKIWTVGKAGVGRVREKKKRSEKIREEDAGARKGRKVAIHCVFFQWFGAPEGRRVGSLKRRVRSQLARWEIKNCTLLWLEAHFEVKMHKAHQLQTSFRSCDVEKVHAVVARSTFPSQNV